MTELALDLDLGLAVDPFDPTAAPPDRTVRAVDESDLPAHLLDTGTASLTAEASHAAPMPVTTGFPGKPIRATHPLEVIGPDEVRAPIRAWFDDAGRLVRLVISNRWRERLLGREVGAEITEVLRQPGSAAAARTTPYRPTLLPTKLTQAWLDQMYEESARDWAQVSAGTAAADRNVSGRSRSRLVTVELGSDGLARTVRIDPMWLGRCRVGDMCEAVVEAHQAATDALATLPRPAESLATSMAARTDALFAVLAGRTAA